MKRALLQVFGWVYVTYALLTAYCALGTLQAATTSHVSPRSYVQAIERLAGDGKRVDIPDEGAFVDVSDEYFIEIWVTDDCKYCDLLKKHEVPKFKKAGVRYKVFNTSIFPAPEGMKVAPTIKLFRQDMLIKQFDGYVKAEKVLEMVVERSVLLS